MQYRSAGVHGSHNTRKSNVWNFSLKEIQFNTQTHFSHLHPQTILFPWLARCEKVVYCCSSAGLIKSFPTASQVTIQFLRLLLRYFFNLTGSEFSKTRRFLRCTALLSRCGFTGFWPQPNNEESSLWTGTKVLRWLIELWTKINLKIYGSSSEVSGTNMLYNGQLNKGKPQNKDMENVFRVSPTSWGLQTSPLTENE